LQGQAEEIGRRRGEEGREVKRGGGGKEGRGRGRMRVRGRMRGEGG